MSVVPERVTPQTNGAGGGTGASLTSRRLATMMRARFSQLPVPAHERGHF